MVGDRAVGLIQSGIQKMTCNRLQLPATAHGTSQSALSCRVTHMNPIFSAPSLSVGKLTEMLPEPKQVITSTSQPLTWEM